MVNIILGCDVSPEYQPGFDVARAYSEGIRFIGVKLSDGAKGTDIYEEGIDFIRRAQSLRMVAIGYHYIRGNVDPVYQGEIFADQLRRAGCPGMLDLESGTVDDLRETYYQVTKRNQKVVFTY